MFKPFASRSESLSREIYRRYRTTIIPKHGHKHFEKRLFICDSNISCAGKISFYNCTFDCDIPQNRECITILPLGEAVFKNCTFKRSHSNSGLFLSGNKGCLVSFIDCTFVECNNFVQLDDCTRVAFTRCKFQDCFDAVVKVSVQPEAQFAFHDNIWYVTASPVHQKASAFTLLGENRLFVFENCCIQYAGTDSSYSLITAPQNSLCLLNCSFDGSIFPIHAVAVIGCIFRHCRNALVTNSAVSALYQSLIENCHFIQCSECIQAGADTEILHSTFTACTGALIGSASKLGHVHIADCKFFDCVVNARGSACIELDRDCSVITGKINKMENCTFENCRAEKGNLIGYQNEITPGYVAVISTCRFNSCSVGENGNLIGQKVSTRNFYSKAQSYQIYTFYRERAKFILTNCRIDSDTVLDNTPKTQYDTYDKAKCAARRGGLKEKIESESAHTPKKISRWTIGVHSV